MTQQQTDINWRNSKAWQNWWKKFSPIEKFGIRLAVFAVFIGILGYMNQHAGFAVGFTILSNLFEDFYANVSSELISVVITILVLDRLNSRRQNEQELTRLKALLASNERTVTGIAVAELRAKEWLYDGSLKDTILWNANLHDEILISASLQSVNLVQANLENADLEQVDLRNSDLRFANLKNANLEECNLHNANLSDAILEGACLSGALLKDTKFIEANLQSAQFIEADLEKANLWIVCLHGVNLKGANLEGTKFFAVECDETTILPDGTNWTPDTDWSKFGAIELDYAGGNKAIKLAKEHFVFIN
ncbi:MAG: pentapeptide repeat-containing protein [Aggregatilineales bacterium]